MNWNNRLPAPDVGEQALEHCDQLKLSVWKCESGNVVVNYEIHGSLGSFDEDEDEDESEGGGLATREPTDLSLVFDLLRRMQRREGDL